MTDLIARKTLHTRIERITLHLTSDGIKRLLEEAGEIPKGFKIESVEFEPGDITLVRELPSETVDASES